MRTCRYEIPARGFDRAGAATGDLKARLKRLGVEPDAVRRAVIAAYEAAMNIVIHAERGSMRAEVAPGRLRMVFEDCGPGIADIEKAMAPGYSTAPDFARSMGFGAGLGLANMKRHADRFDLGSEVGQGIRVVMEVLFSKAVVADTGRHSIRLDPARCRACLACVRECPTQALRLWSGTTEMLDHLCVDCGRCVAVCPARAIVADVPDGVSQAGKRTPLAAPAALFVQFGARACADRVVSELESMGFAPVHILNDWEEAVDRAAWEQAGRGSPLPVISPVCPAVLNLIELRFPALIPHVAPYLTPVEAAAEELDDGTAFAVSCPAQQTALGRLTDGRSRRILSLAALRDALEPRLAESGSPPSGAKANETDRPRALKAKGMAHVSAVLDEMENGLLADARVVKLYACEGGCFGAPLASEEAAVSRYRWSGATRPEHPPRRAIRRRSPIEPRSGIRLHPEMARAIEMLREIDELAAELPGRNCALCGSPTCAAFAEDVVAGRAQKADCCFLSEGEHA